MEENKKIIKKIYEKPDIEIKKMNIIKDGRQYSIRIPKDFIETIKGVNGNLENLKFKFILKIPPLKSSEKPKLSGELIYEK